MKLHKALKSGSGARIRLHHRHLQGRHPLHLTQMQINRMQRRHGIGKGMDLMLSHAQLKHMAKHGKGFFSSLAKSVAGPLLQQVAAPLINKGVSALANKISGNGRRRRAGKGFFGDLAKKGLNALAPVAVDLAKQGLSKGADYLGQKVLNKVSGSGRKRRVGRPRKGDGLFAPGGRGLYTPGYGLKHSKHGGNIVDDVLGSLF